MKDQIVQELVHWNATTHLVEEKLWLPVRVEVKRRV